jgi:hypothetical protein
MATRFATYTQYRVCVVLIGVARALRDELIAALAPEPDADGATRRYADNRYPLARRRWSPARDAI